MTKNLNEAQLQLALQRRIILLTMLQRRESPREPAPFKTTSTVGSSGRWVIAWS